MASRAEQDWRSLRFLATQLFTPSSPVATAELFAGRTEQIDRLVDAIGERGRHAILYGEPGVGKTSIAKVMRHLIPDQLRTVQYIRHPVVSNDTFETIWKEVFRQIAFEIEREGVTETHNVSEIYVDGISPSDVVRELSYLSEATIPIIVIDEYQQFSDNEGARLVSETIKAASDEGINATIIVVGVGDNVDDLVRGHSSIIRCSEEVMMPRMSNAEMKELIDTRINQLGMKIENNAKWKIIGLAKGLPAFAHALGKSSTLSAIARKKKVVTETDVDQGIIDAISSSQHTLKTTYENATNSNHAKATFKQLLTACALARTDASGWFAPKDVEGPFSQLMGHPRGIDSFNSNLTDFALEKRAKILDRKGSERNYRFRFREPAMQPYTLMKGIEVGLVTEDAMKALRNPEEPDLFASER
jgi:Cdc6-like AAA superfamily ATPase